MLLIYLHSNHTLTQQTKSTEGIGNLLSLLLSQGDLPFDQQVALLPDQISRDTSIRSRHVDVMEKTNSLLVCISISTTILYTSD